VPDNSHARHHEARTAEQPRGTETARKVSVITPVYDEAQTLPEVVRRVKSAAFADPEWEIILVDDGSTDDTAGVCARLCSQVDRVLRYERNRDKGAALPTGQHIDGGRYLRLPCFNSLHRLTSSAASALCIVL
jgi:cellulose synthase/poly-beta-1,6-N-acetylglucosamine synthase-like glycosyltransferase